MWRIGEILGDFTRVLGDFKLKKAHPLLKLRKLSEFGDL